MDIGNLVNQLLASSQTQNQAINAAGADIQNMQQQSEGLQQQSLNTQRQVADTSATLAAKKAQIDYSVNKQIEDLQRTFNMDPTLANNQIAKSLSEVESAQKEYVPARAEYDKLATTGFLENPIGYIMAQIKLPQAAAKVNAIAAREERANSELQTRTSLLAATKATVTANTADALRSLQLEDAVNQRQAADARFQEIEAKNFVQAANNRMQLIQIANMQADNQRGVISTVASLQNMAEARADRAEAAAARAEERTIRRAQMQELLDKRQLEADEKARLNQRLQVVSQSLGMQEPMTVDRLKTLTNKKSQEVWLNAALTGQMGEDLKESVEFYLGGSNRQAVVAAGGASVLGTAQKLEQVGASYQSLAERSAMAANPTGKKPSSAESRAMGFKLYQDEITASMSSPTAKDDLSSSRWNGTFNPYVANFLGLTAASNQLPQYASLKNNVVKKTVETLMQSGAVRGENLLADQQQQVLLAIEDQVRNKVISPKKAAADVAEFFKAAADYNYRLNKYDLFSLPKQQSYLFSLEGSIRPGDNRTKINLMDPTAVENALVNKIVRRNPTSYMPGIREVLSNQVRNGTYQQQ